MASTSGSSMPWHHPTAPAAVLTESGQQPATWPGQPEGMKVWKNPFCRDGMPIRRSARLAASVPVRRSARLTASVPSKKVAAATASLPAKSRKRSAALAMKVLGPLAGTTIVHKFLIEEPDANFARLSAVKKVLETANAGAVMDVETLRANVEALSPNETEASEIFHCTNKPTSSQAHWEWFPEQQLATAQSGPVRHWPPQQWHVRERLPEVMCPPPLHLQKAHVVDSSQRYVGSSTLNNNAAVIGGADTQCLVIDLTNDPDDMPVTAGNEDLMAVHPARLAMLGREHSVHNRDDHRMKDQSADNRDDLSIDRGRGGKRKRGDAPPVAMATGANGVVVQDVRQSSLRRLAYENKRINMDYTNTKDTPWWANGDGGSACVYTDPALANDLHVMDSEPVTAGVIQENIDTTLEKQQADQVTRVCDAAIEAAENALYPTVASYRSRSARRRRKREERLLKRPILAKLRNVVRDEIGSKTSGEHIVNAFREVTKDLERRFFPGLR